MTGQRTMVQALTEALDEAAAGGLAHAETAEILAEVITAHREIADPASSADVMHFSSGVSVASGDPFVVCALGAERWQWTPEVARQHAAHVTQVAEAAGP